MGPKIHSKFHVPLILICFTIGSGNGHPWLHCSGGHSKARINQALKPTKKHLGVGTLVPNVQTPPKKKKRGKKKNKLPCDFEDSGVLNRSSCRTGNYIIPGDSLSLPEGLTAAELPKAMGGSQ